MSNRYEIFEIHEDTEQTSTFSGTLAELYTFFTYRYEQLAAMFNPPRTIAELCIQLRKVNQGPSSFSYAYILRGE